MTDKEKARKRLQITSEKYRDGWERIFNSQHQFSAPLTGMKIMMEQNRTSQQLRHQAAIEAYIKIYLEQNNCKIEDLELQIKYSYPDVTYALKRIAQSTPDQRNDADQ